MRIKKLNITNFKCFKTKFTLELNSDLNILVGDNEAGKSTILDAINLVLTGFLNGKYLKGEITQYLFNSEIVVEYITSLTTGKPLLPPSIEIEVFLDKDDYPLFIGDDNSEKTKACGLYLRIHFDNQYEGAYNELVQAGDVTTIPIEYYDVTWKSFARDGITGRSIPIKSAFIDSSSNKYQNGSDIYISRIVRDSLEEKEIVEISQAHRKMKESFMGNDAIKTINTRIQAASKISSKEIKISVELSSKNAWENSLTTYLDNIPFHFIGKGEQCIIKTRLALSHKKAIEANIILLEEPENHLSHTKLSQLIHDIQSNSEGKQVIISTHSSFVANKLGLNNLILLHKQKTVCLNDLKPETQTFFEKLPGYDTLRLILCRKAILVEGDSDELIVQKAYQLKNAGRLPIQDGIDVISVGTSFLRFLEIAEKIEKPVNVVTDNDGDVDALNVKYDKYVGVNKKPSINILFDSKVDSGDLLIKSKPFNYNTLEPKLVAANSLSKVNEILGTTYTDIVDLHKHMRREKTNCALKFFGTNEPVICIQPIKCIFRSSDRLITFDRNITHYGSVRGIVQISKAMA